MSKLHKDTLPFHELDEKYIVDTANSGAQKMESLTQISCDTMGNTSFGDKSGDKETTSIWKIQKLRVDTQLSFLSFFCHDSVKEIDLSREVSFNCL